MEILRIKAVVRSRDRHACTKCGIPDYEHRERYGRGLEVHRLVPGSPYTLEGCVTLCQKCHYQEPRQVTNSGLPPPEIDMAELCSVAEAAVLLGVTKPRIEQYIKEGRLAVAAVVIGVRTLLRAEVARFRKVPKLKRGPKPKEK